MLTPISQKISEIEYQSKKFHQISQSDLDDLRRMIRNYCEEKGYTLERRKEND